jgi:non-homologous end joining protein Ku
MHFMYFADEVREFGQIPTGAGAKVPKREIDLARDLIDKMSVPEFDPESITTNIASGFSQWWSRKRRARKLPFNRQHQSDEARSSIYLPR